MKEYFAESMWSGFTGGYGSESYIAQRMNARSRDGWQLVRTEVARCLWWGFIPRFKLLLVFERADTAGATNGSDARIAVTA